MFLLVSAARLTMGSKDAGARCANERAVKTINFELQLNAVFFIFSVLSFNFLICTICTKFRSRVPHAWAGEPSHFSHLGRNA